MASNDREARTFVFTQRHFSNYEFCGKREKEKLVENGKRNMKYESAERKPLGDHLQPKKRLQICRAAFNLHASFICQIFIAKRKIDFQYFEVSHDKKK